MSHHTGCQPQRLASANSLSQASRRSTVLPAPLASVLLAICTALLWAAPAAAVPGLQFVSAVSVTDSSSVKTVTVSCPAGTKVYSVGGGVSVISAGAGKVLLQQVFPNSTLSGVTVQGAEDWALGFSGTWRLSAQAVCGNPVANLQRVKTSSASGAFTGNQVTMACPASTVLYGMGFAIHGENGANGKVFLNLLTRSDLVPVGVDARAEAHDPDISDPWSLDGFAICGASAPGYVTTGGSSPIDSTSPKTLITSCPAGKKVHGSGFFNIENGAQGDLIFQGWNYDVNATRAVFTFDEDEPNAAIWRINSFVVCAN